MRLLNIRGKLVSKNVLKYKIQWDEPSASKIQFATKQFLKPFWAGMVVYEEFPVYGTRLRVDILNATKRIAIEVNGRQHGDFVKFFHTGREKWRQSIKRDCDKHEWLIKNDFQVIELETAEIPLLSVEFIEEKFGVCIV